MKKDFNQANQEDDHALQEDHQAHLENENVLRETFTVRLEDENMLPGNFTVHLEDESDRLEKSLREKLRLIIRFGTV